MPCPINSKFFRPQRKKSKRKLVAYVGTMLPWKGAGIAFDICKKIEQQRDDVDFIFIGPGYLKPELIKKSSDRFTFKENIPIKELANWYNKADVMLYPTQYESFGRVLAEAMACGTPIVSTKVGAVPETIGNGGMLVDYGDWKTMERNVLEILDSKSICSRLGASAIKHSKQYGFEVVGKKVEGIYQEVLNEK